MNRREFIGATLASTVAVTAGAAEAQSSAGSKLKLGLIGCGGYGLTDLRAAWKAGGVECIALADVDSKHLEQAADAAQKQQGARPRTFKRYEDLLQVPGLQAVIIATPPHWHALQFMAALAKGLDIYCEKPLAYDAREGEAMVAAAERTGRIVQVGFQRRQSPAIQQVREYVQSGKPGRIVQVDAQIHYTAGLRDTTPQDPPESLDWDLWCGPAPKLPYSPQVGHFAWRLEKEYGHGHLVDWGIHLIDATRWILGESVPKSVHAAGGLYFFKDKITTPDTLTVHFEYATCPVVWRHRIWGAAEYTPEVSNGIFFYGEKETIFVTDDRWVMIPKGRGREREVHEAKADMGLQHMTDFLKAVRTRRQPLCTPADAFASTLAVQLGAIAYETGTPVVWDAGRREIMGNAAAARLLRREYREPYKHPGRA